MFLFVGWVPYVYHLPLLKKWPGYCLRLAWMAHIWLGPSLSLVWLLRIERGFCLFVDGVFLKFGLVGKHVARVLPTFGLVVLRLA